MMPCYEKVSSLFRRVLITYEDLPTSFDNSSRQKILFGQLILGKESGDIACRYVNRLLSSAYHTHSQELISVILNHVYPVLFTLMLQTSATQIGITGWTLLRG